MYPHDELECLEDAVLDRNTGELIYEEEYQYVCIHALQANPMLAEDIAGKFREAGYRIEGDDYDAIEQMVNWEPELTWLDVAEILFSGGQYMPVLIDEDGEIVND